VGDGRRVVYWTPSARDSLDEILAVIAVDSPAAAAKIAEVLLGAGESLSLFAERGRVVPRDANQHDPGDLPTSIGSCTRSQRRGSNSAVLHGAMDFEGWLRRQR
jgi:plasmid stabilization system protein ParE